MHTNKSNIAKGIGIAMAVGGATAMLSSTMMSFRETPCEAQYGQGGQSG